MVGVWSRAGANLSRKHKRSFCFFESALHYLREQIRPAVFPVHKRMYTMAELWARIAQKFWPWTDSTEGTIGFGVILSIRRDISNVCGTRKGKFLNSFQFLSCDAARPHWRPCRILLRDADCIACKPDSDSNTCTLFSLRILAMNFPPWCQTYFIPRLIAADLKLQKSLYLSLESAKQRKVKVISAKASSLRFRKQYLIYKRGGEKHDRYSSHWLACPPNQSRSNGQWSRKDNIRLRNGWLHSGQNSVSYFIIVRNFTIYEIGDN